MTQQEYTGQQFEIEFARAWYEYVKSGKVGVDPRVNWEHLSYTEWHPHDTPMMPMCHEGNKYRWKPAPKRMVTIGYASGGGAWQSKELVAPEVEAPAIGTPVYVLNKTPEVEWEDRPWLVSWLNAGLVFLTGEDAAAMAEWLAVCRRGGAA